MDDRPLSLREQGIRALREGDDDRAIDLLTRAVLVDSRDAEARACLGITASRKGLHVRAISALREAVALDPANTNFRYNLGVALERANEPREAYLAYQETLRRAPDHAQARQKLAALTPPPDHVQAQPAPVPSEPVEAPETTLPPVDHTPSPAPRRSEAATSSPGEDAAANALPPSVASAPGPTVPPAPQLAQTPTYAPPVSPGADAPPPAWRQPPPTGYPAVNPYAGGYQPIPAYGSQYLRAHRGGMVLGLGIGGLVGLMCCGIFAFPLGIAAWVTGNGDLKEMDAGVMDPDGRGQTQAGRIMGIVVTALSGLGVLGVIVYIVIAILAAAAGAASTGAP